MKKEPCIRAICFVTFFVFSFVAAVAADYLTADPQPSEMVTKYEVKLNSEVFPAEAKTMDENQVELYYSIDHLDSGRYSAFARAGNDAGDVSAWSDELIFYRGVPTPQSIGLYCGAEELPMVEEPKRLPQDGFTVYHVSSAQRIEEDGANAIDGKLHSFWHSGWVGANPPDHPHEIQIDLGKIYTVSGFWYQSRQSTTISNCMVSGYKFYVSMDGVGWAEVASGSFPDSQNEHFVSFASCKAGYVSLVALSSTNGSSCTAISELNILGY